MHLEQAGLLLLVHGEVTDADVDFFDREKVFIATKLKPLLDTVRCLSLLVCWLAFCFCMSVLGFYNRSTGAHMASCSAPVCPQP